jgi:hypothetical protein
VRTTVRGRLAPAPRGADEPEVSVAVHGTAVGVSVHGTGECLLGSRLEGKVHVWRVAPVQLLPDELSCDAAIALDGLGASAPL